MAAPGLELSPASSPPARAGARLAFDPATGQIILFGGDGYSGPFGDTWAWNGTDWSQLAPASSPPARDYASMAFDAVTGQVLLFGGYSVRDTWAWDDGTWTELNPAASPPTRDAASLAFDPATGQLLLFGGNSNGLVADTWVFGFAHAVNGWTQLSPASSPPALDYSSMAFDPATGQLILFGGDSHSGFLGDTWAWTGGTWTQLNPASSPPARIGASMAFDPGHRPAHPLRRPRPQ